MDPRDRLPLLAQGVRQGRHRHRLRRRRVPGLGDPDPAEPDGRGPGLPGALRVSDPVRFLTSFSQALSPLGLYGDDHPATIRACDTAYRHLTDLQAESGKLEFTFLPGEVLFGRDLLPELEGWEWSTRFAQGAMDLVDDLGVRRRTFRQDEGGGLRDRGRVGNAESLGRQAPE